MLLSKMVGDNSEVDEGFNRKRELVNDLFTMFYDNYRKGRSSHFS